MTRSLYTKFLLGYLVFGLLGFIFIATMSSEITYQYLLEEKSQSLYDEANLLASTYSDIYQGKNISLSTANPQLQAVATYLKAQAWVINQKGSVVAETVPASHIGTAIDGFDPTVAGNRSYMTGSFFGMFDKEMLSVIAPITGNFNTYGYVVIHMPIEQIVHGKDRILNIVYITALVVFILSLIILLVFTKTVYVPLKKITAGAKEYAAGNLSHTIKVTSADEMGYLANTLNYMSSELNKMEEYQHSFIANVSHDFRSPLTSIKGYVEAMLDGTISPEMQERYLGIVLSETERLNKLTEGLLLLNSFDDQRIYLDLTEFDISEVIRHTLDTFEVLCQKKNLAIRTDLPDEPLIVCADMGRIQQVLYNLIDNAIKFSPAGKEILVSVHERKKLVFVSVKDFGEGISKENLPKIWERFYKTDVSRGRDKKGIGLGLSIVREIIRAHSQNINVISTEGVGTEFIFTLATPERSNPHRRDGR